MSQVLEISPETVSLVESYAKHSGMTVEEYVRSLLPAETDLGLAANGSGADFDSDMDSFAEAAEDLPIYQGSYSREEIYADHN